MNIAEKRASARLSSICFSEYLIVLRAKDNTHYILHSMKEYPATVKG